MNKDATEKVQRRTFVKGTAVAGAAVSTGVLSTRAMAESLDEEPKKTAHKGYQETEHVREYYKLARF